MSRLTFVRHGESEANAARRIGGDADADLTRRGEAQARSLQETLAGLAIDRRVSSDLRRAVRTAELGWPSPFPALEIHAGLRERTLGDWEGRPLDALRDDGRANTLLRWDGTPPGGESLRALARRVLRWFADHDDGSRMLIVVHGGVVRVLVGLLDGVPTDQIGGLRVANAQVEQRSVAPAEWGRLLKRIA